MSTQSPSWMRLDNAAKIYPAAKRKNWVAMFRLSATLDEPIDPEILAAAQQRTLRRFQAFSVHLKKGFFWYYLEQAEGGPPITVDRAYPCAHLSLRENKGYAFRVLYYQNRIAAEFYHVLTDGTGGLMFMKTLTAEYLELKYNIKIPRDDSILDCDEEAGDEEIEDCFLSNAGTVSASRKEKDAYRIKGTTEPDGFVNLTTAIIDTEEIIARAKEKKATVTEYMAAALLCAADTLQRKQTDNVRRMKEVKVSLPVNLRKIFPSKTTRNFASYINPGIDPAMGSYTMDEVINIVHHFAGSELTKKNLKARFTTNVKTEKNMLLRLTPLFIKDFVMKVVFNTVGDKKNTITFSNLGVITLPEEMRAHVERMEFIIGPLSSNPVVIGAASYGGKLYMNITRTIIEPDLEREFLTSLVKLGIHVKIESNQKEN